VPLLREGGTPPHIPLRGPHAPPARAHRRGRACRGVRRTPEAARFTRHL